MKILVAYGSLEGHSRTIAEHIRELVEQAGHAGRFVSITEATGPIADDIALAFFCAPVHQGSYPEAFETTIRRWTDRLAYLPDAFVSVSLTAAGPPGHLAELDRFVQDMSGRTGWKPDRVHHAAGALKFSEYGPIKRWMMRQIARANGYTGREDKEFTDWPALDRFVEESLADLPR